MKSATSGVTALKRRYPQNQKVLLYSKGLPRYHRRSTGRLHPAARQPVGSSLLLCTCAHGRANGLSATQGTWADHVDMMGLAIHAYMKI